MMSSSESKPDTGSNPWRLLCTALTFLTRLPLVARFAYPSEAAIAASAFLWPLVGVLIGACSWAAFALGFQFWNITIAAIFAIATSALITGAFHEDGLADSADGFYGGYTIERRLEIMKDSRIGTFGAMALVLISFALIAALQLIPPKLTGSALIWGHVLARTSSLGLTYALTYARFSGQNKPIAEGINLRVCLAAYFMTTCIGFIIVWINPNAAKGVLVSCATSLMFWPVAGFYVKRKIGGISGDALGAINHLTLLLVLLVFAAGLKT
jgi:adenosylcobinamide-GDP ribazoletransferase